MRKKSSIFTMATALLVCGCASGPRTQPVPSAVATTLAADDVESAVELLRQERDLLADEADGPSSRLRRMIQLGLWTEAEQAFRRLGGSSPELLTVEAELRFQQHRYNAAERLVAEALAGDPDQRHGRLLTARLQIQRWNLDSATSVAEHLLRESERDEAAALLLGRVRLLNKQFPEALGWAKRVQAWNGQNAQAFALEAETRFWDQDPKGAEAPLIHALELDPFDADARFSYGYAIWRRVDATQLDAMAAHWELALEVNPLHFLTHWHWGNGHTNLTYADYAHPSDSLVREGLKPLDELISQNRLNEAIDGTREVEGAYPESVLPAMMRASAFYMSWDADRDVRLDSAQSTFVQILRRKAHYGPAHNGLAAVIKQRQFAYLSSFDSLEAVIANTPIPGDSAFDAIFVDVDYFPGDRVRRMARQQLGPSIAYLPMLQRLARPFVIPPLHKDLAEVMGRSFFRTATTFDNRQWMDIRGVGSGATGIEYVERGGHWERNVLNHEYTHLVHGAVFTDSERRKVRASYYAAMDEGRALDYYASNNESEFLAQAYPAYLAPVKAHPLNHKSMNTRDDLRTKDPETYRFVEELIERQTRYLDGDSTALAGNWAEVFVALSERASGDSGGNNTTDRALALLDTALMWDEAYLPAHLRYAATYRDAGMRAEANEWLEKAEQINPTYAPIFAARAELAAVGSDDTFDTQVELYRRSLELEDDLAIRASLFATLRQLFLDEALIPAAIDVAEEYALLAPTVSTYLRDRRDDALTFAAYLRSTVGYADESLRVLQRLAKLKPQNYNLRGDYADALAVSGRYSEAIATLQEVQRILQSAGRSRPGFAVQIAEFHLRNDDAAAASESIQPILSGRLRADSTDNRYARVLAALGEQRALDAWLGLQNDSAELSVHARADRDFTRGFIAESAAQLVEAAEWYRRALEQNAYHREARARLVGVLSRPGDHEEAERIRAAALALQLPLGPAFERDVERAIAGRW